MAMNAKVANVTRRGGWCAGGASVFVWIHSCYLMRGNLHAWLYLVTFAANFSLMESLSRSLSLVLTVSFARKLRRVHSDAHCLELNGNNKTEQSFVRVYLIKLFKGYVIKEILSP